MSRMNTQEQVTPKLHLLSQDQKIRMHDFSVRILEKTGIKVESKTAVNLFAKSNAVKIDNDIVFIQRELIEHSIKTSPSQFDIFNKKRVIAYDNFNNEGHHKHHFGEKKRYKFISLTETRKAFMKDVEEFEKKL